MMPSLSGFIYHVLFKNVYTCTCIVYMGMLIMKLLSGTKKKKKKKKKKNLQILSEFTTPQRFQILGCFMSKRSSLYQ